MKTAVISRKIGRLGNNLIQIANLLYYAKNNGLEYIVPETDISYSFRSKGANDNDIFGSPFFYRKKDFKVTDYNDLFKESPRLLREFLIPHLKFDIGKHLEDDVLTIHVRSGDICQPNPHPEYVQHPLSFFNYFIKKYEKVILVAQDLKYNIILNELLKNKKVQLADTPTLREGVQMIVRSKNLVLSGVGTFAPSLSMLNGKLKNLYITDLNMHCGVRCLKSPDCRITIYNISKTQYIKPGEWRYNDEQKKILLNYKMDESLFTTL